MTGTEKKLYKKQSELNKTAKLENEIECIDQGEAWDEKWQGCTNRGCGLSEVRCPDSAIEVYQDEWIWANDLRAMNLRRYKLHIPM